MKRHTRRCCFLAVFLSNASVFAGEIQYEFASGTRVYYEVVVGADAPKEHVASATKTLGGDGKPIFGIFGRKGLNVDAIGLVSDSPAKSHP